MKRLTALVRATNPKNCGNEDESEDDSSIQIDSEEEHENTDVNTMAERFERHLCMVPTVTQVPAL